MYEKYNADRPGEGGGGGEYEPQVRRLLGGIYRKSGGLWLEQWRCLGLLGQAVGLDPLENGSHKPFTTCLQSRLSGRLPGKSPLKAQGISVVRVDV